MGSRLTRRTFLGGAFGALLAACGVTEPEDDITVTNGTPTQAPTTTMTAVPPEPPTEETPNPTPTAEPEPTLVVPSDPVIPTPVPGQQDVSLLVVVDKERALPNPYIPPGLAWIPGEWLIPGYGGLLARSDALEAYGQMREAALAEDIEFGIRSAYRSYEEQVTTFDYWIGYYGSEAEALRWSAPPGHSEHQLGTALDITAADVAWELEQVLGDTPPGEWLAEHSPEFGFALSYPRDGESTTGYVYEPWHFRYVGVNAARAWRDSGLILIDFLE
jgi:D-alanyl-D-alanine carboxypeptidase